MSFFDFSKSIQFSDATIEDNSVYKCIKEVTVNSNRCKFMILLFCMGFSLVGVNTATGGENYIKKTSFNTYYLTAKYNDNGSIKLKITAINDFRDRVHSITKNVMTLIDTIKNKLNE